jgi:predicted dehydrogenase
MNSNNPIKPNILIIGTGSIGERHLRCFLATDRCNVSFCEPIEDRRADIATRYNITGYPSLDDALSAGSIDAAVVATPAQTHIPISTQLASKGVHLMIEKPLGVSLDGIDELAAVVAEQSVQVAIGYTLRSMPPVRDMRRAILDGRFGKPLQVTVVGGQHFPLYRPAYREIYYTKHETGGGAIQDCITHHLNTVEWLVGPITRLVADADHLALEGVEVEDTVHILTRHGSVLGSFSINQHQAPNETTVTIICERGAARWETAHNRWLSCVEPGAQWTVEKAYHAERDEYYINQANSFLDQLEKQSEPVCSLAEGIQTLRVNLAALNSAKTEKWETIQS